MLKPIKVVINNPNTKEFTDKKRENAKQDKITKLASKINLGQAFCINKSEDFKDSYREILQPKRFHVEILLVEGILKKVVRRIL